MHAVRDARGRSLTLPRRPERIVSLVPSITESLFALGVGPRVVGVTEYCVHPEDARTRATVVGGTHGFDLATVQALKPDLVIANQEENPKDELETLAELVPTYITFPRTARESIELIGTLGTLADVEGAAAQYTAEAQAAFAEAVADRPVPAPRVLYFIWRKPWMTVNADTYIHDMLAACGARNVAAGYAERYPTIAPDDVPALAPEAIFLSTEPFAFTEAHAEEWRARTDLPAARLGQVRIVDGEMCAWYGTRVAAGIRYLSERIRSLQTGGRA